MMENKETCKWKLDYHFDEDGSYFTGCGVGYCFEEKDLKNQEYNFCPKCGKEIEEV